MLDIDRWILGELTAAIKGKPREELVMLAQVTISGDLADAIFLKVGVVRKLLALPKSKRIMHLSVDWVKGALVARWNTGGLYLRATGSLQGATVWGELQSRALVIWVPLDR